MLVRDNQQATNWFAGILEGEGSFFLRPTGYKAVTIPNNDLDIITECERFLTSNCILFKRYEVKAGKKKGHVIVISMQDCKNLHTRIASAVQCRTNEFQRIVGASETERELTVDCDWVAGIFEAEGAFFLSENHKHSFTARIELDNTNERIIQRIVNNLHAMGCAWYIKQYVPDKRKPYKKITIQGVKRCKRFLDSIQCWRSQRIKLKTEVLLEYCRVRLSKPEKAHYGDQEWRLVIRLRQLNS